MAALFRATDRAAAGSCAALEGTAEDKLVVYYSTDRVWVGRGTVAQTLTEALSYPRAGRTSSSISPACRCGGNNANFA
jgi:hypothetical protein